MAPLRFRDTPPGKYPLIEVEILTHDLCRVPVIGEGTDQTDQHGEENNAAHDVHGRSQIEMIGKDTCKHRPQRHSENVLRDNHQADGCGASLRVGQSDDDGTGARAGDGSEGTADKQATICMEEPGAIKL